MSFAALKKQVTLTPGEVAAALGDVRVLFELGSATERWTLITTPKDSGPAGAITQELEYFVDRDLAGDNYYPVSPGGPATVDPNEANVVTREDMTRAFIAHLVFIAPYPDGDTILNLYTLE